MQNRKSADVAITVGWSAGTAIQCAVSIGNTRGKHSSAALAAWNISQTIKFTAFAIEAIKNRQGTNQVKS
jgi:hypothetical protein